MTIAEIKSRLTLSEVLRHYGLKPDSNNRLYCPWHNDKTPSLQIYPKTSTWTCFSSNCDADSGDQIDFIMLSIAKSRGIAGRMAAEQFKHEAILKAKTMIGIEVIKKAKTKTTTDYEKLFAQFRANVKSEKVKSYLERRNLNHKRIEIGFSTLALKPKQILLIDRYLNQDRPELEKRTEIASENLLLTKYGKPIKPVAINR